MSLDSAFKKAILKSSEDALARAVTKMIVKKLARQGVRLTARQQAKVLARVRAKDFERLSFPEIREEKNVRISFTKRDLKKVDRLIARALDLIPDLVEKESNTLAPRILRRLHGNWPDRFRFEDAQRRAFEDRLNQRWHRPLDSLGMMLTIARELGGSLSAQYAKENRTPYLTSALLRLHARGCQVAYEVRTLLGAGLADAAMARWRTLHELAVTALYLQAHGESMAERYWAHHVIESCRAADLRQKHAARLRHRRLSRAYVDKLKQKKAALLVRFGKFFGETYGWAAQTLDERVGSFAQVEDKVELDHWRLSYKSASYNVHANPHGITDRLGVYDSDVLLAGPSNFGLAAPGQNTAISLNQLTAALVHGDEATFDTVVSLKVLSRLGVQAVKEFVQVQKQIQAEEDRRRAKRARRAARLGSS
jgi:hypothetical protein